MLPPGPRLPALFGTLWWIARPVESFEALFRDYGDMCTVDNFILGKEVVLNHPDLVKPVFTGDPDVFHAGDVNRTIAPVVGESSVFLLDGKRHLRERRLLLPPFHGERMLAYADVMRDVAQRALAGLPIDEPFALLPHMQRITLEIILRAVLGVNDEREMQEIEAPLRALVERIQTPRGMLMMIPALQRDLGPLTAWRDFRKKLAVVDEALFALIARGRARHVRRKAEGALPSGDILELLLEAVDEEGAPMTDRELRDELMSLILAGHETSATALAWFFEEVLRRPEVHARLVEEITGETHGGPLARAHVTKLDYLDSVIKEVLRLRPIVPLVARKLKAPIRLREYEIPEGVLMVPCACLVQRHPGVYEAASELRAERFLGKKPDPYAWFPFGGGTRRCIGMAFALFEMKVVLATMLPSMRVRLARDAPAKVVLRSFVFAPKGGTEVVVTRGRPNGAVRQHARSVGVSA